MTFHGPSSGNWDIPVEPTLTTDYNHVSAFTQIYEEYTTGPPDMDSILLNGIGNYAGVNPGGHKYTLGFAPKKRYLLRIINTSVDTTFIVTIDNHVFEVLSSDFVPIKPYTTSGLVVGIGQRYHVVVEALSFPPGTDLSQQNFWIRTIPATNCANFALGDEPDERQGIIRYKDYSTVVPTSRRHSELNGTALNCRDELYETLVPVVPWTIGPPANNFTANDTYEVGLVQPSSDTPPQYGMFQRWAMGDKPMWLDFSDPTLFHVHDDPKTFDPRKQIITQDVPKDSWVYLLIIGPPTNLNGNRHFVPAAHPVRVLHLLSLFPVAPPRPSLTPIPSRSTSTATTSRSCSSPSAATTTHPPSSSTSTTRRAATWCCCRPAASSSSPSAPTTRARGSSTATSPGAAEQRAAPRHQGATVPQRL